jgi:hypothetical protein
MGTLKVFTMFFLLALLACAGDSGGPLTVYTLAADYTMVGDDITHTSCSAAVDEAYDMAPCCPDITNEFDFPLATWIVYNSIDLNISIFKSSSN